MREDLAGLLSALVAIDSVNPALVPGGAGEAEIAAFVAGWARAAGLRADVLEATPGRPSVLVRAPGRGGGRTLLLCAHLDTVGYDGMRDPLVARIDDDRLYGRGAYDMKAGLAAALLACRSAAALDLAGDVVVAAVADEEHASLGVQEALRAVRADAAVVTEPTELAVAVAHKGFVWSEIAITGRAAHGSRPHLGVDAIVKAGPILTALGALDGTLGEHELVGRGSVHAGVVSGGGELSSYPARCVIGLEHRTLPGQSVAKVSLRLSSSSSFLSRFSSRVTIRSSRSLSSLRRVLSSLRVASTAFFDSSRASSINLFASFFAFSSSFLALASAEPLRCC